MKILWITNILLPDICKELNIVPPVTGGWMVSMLNSIKKLYPNVEMAVATPYGKDKIFIKKEVNNILYYCLPFKNPNDKYNNKMDSFWTKIKKDFCPDIVHIHGTEYPYGLSYINANGNGNVIISIQGLVSICSKYCLGGIPKSELRKYRTIYDYCRFSLLDLPKLFTQKGKMEIEYINKVKYIIGRTDWDKSHIKCINPEVNYFFCNEILRDTFYDNNKWSYEKCEKYSIFLSQAYYPLKGMHKVIEALPYVIREYPETKVYIAGNDFLKTNTFKDKLKFSTYGNYIKHLIIKYNLEDKFIFLGLLDEHRMKEYYRKAHVFICPSSIENSPNSLGEAQIIGTPSIGAYVGGIPNMIDGTNGLIYRFEEHEMLAMNICKIFNNRTIAEMLSENAISCAEIRHNRKINTIQMMKIYNNIYKMK